MTDSNIKNALAALRNTETRADNHAKKGNDKQAVQTYHNGLLTVESWLTGKHPKAT